MRCTYVRAHGGGATSMYPSTYDDVPLVADPLWGREPLSTSTSAIMCITNLVSFIFEIATRGYL